MDNLSSNFIPLFSEETSFYEEGYKKYVSEDSPGDVKKYKYLGECFGNSAALLHHYWSERSLPNKDDEDNVVKRGYKYTLLDYKRVSKEKHKPFLKNSTVQLYKRGGDDTREDLIEKIKSSLLGQSNTLILHRFWSEKKYKVSLKPKDAHVFPHSILICVDVEKQSYYYYCSSNKGIVTATSQKDIIELYIRHLRKKMYHIFQKNVIHRFEVQDLKLPDPKK